MSVTPTAPLNGEQLFGLGEACRRLPGVKPGTHPQLSTALRWIVSGVRAGRSVVRLEAAKIAGRWFTSKEALDRFVASQQPAPPAGTVTPPRTPAQRSKAAAAASKKLDKLLAAK